MLSFCCLAGAHHLVPAFKMCLEMALARHLPNDAIGALIGKGGETIGRIQKESGARLEVGKEGEKERPVVISGSSDAIDRARRLIDETLGRKSDRLSFAGGRIIKALQKALQELLFDG